MQRFRNLLRIRSQRALREVGNHLVELLAGFRLLFQAIQAATVVEENHVQELGIGMRSQNRLEHVDGPGVILLHVVVVGHLGDGLAHAAAIGELIEHLLVFLERLIEELCPGSSLGGLGHFLVILRDAELSFATQRTLLQPEHTVVNAD